MGSILIAFLAICMACAAVLAGASFFYREALKPLTQWRALRLKQRTRRSATPALPELRVDGRDLATARAAHRPQGGSLVAPGGSREGFPQHRRRRHPVPL